MLFLAPPKVKSITHGEFMNANNSTSRRKSVHMFVSALLITATCFSVTGCGMTENEQRELADIKMRLTASVPGMLLAKDVPQGKTLMADDLEFREIPQYRYPYNGYTKQESSEVIGCVTTRYLGKGAVLMPGDIFPKKDEAKKQSSDQKTEQESK